MKPSCANPCKGGLLIVADQASVGSSLRQVLSKGDYRIRTAAGGRQALKEMKTELPAVIIVDLARPAMDGFAFFKAAHRVHPQAVWLMVAAHGDLTATITAMDPSGVFAFLTQPLNPAILCETVASAFRHVGLMEDNRRLQAKTRRQNRQLVDINAHLETRIRSRTLKLGQAVGEGVRMLALAVEAKDDCTGGHVQRIRQWTEATARALGLAEGEAQDIGLFSMTHDVGKIHVPDAILQKPGSLTETERRVMQTHTVIGEKILGEHPFFGKARQIARSHHERWDGDGYPDGLNGKAIPLAARIVALADVYDALTSVRPYKAAWPRRRALAELQSQRGGAFDPQVLDAFGQVLAREKASRQESQAGIESVKEALEIVN